jgi:hypothetical protein
MVGVVDLATNVSEGIRNTTTVFDDTVELERTRLPRHIHRDKILRVSKNNLLITYVIIIIIIIIVSYT